MKLIEYFLSLCIIFTLVFASCVSCLPQTRRLLHISEDFPSKYYQSVSIVIAIPTPMAPPGLGPSATAWAFDEDHLMTAGHFCEGVTSLSKDGFVKSGVILIPVNSAGRDKKPLKAQILDFQFPLNDMCILKSPNHQLVPMVVSSNFDLVQVEDPVTIVGAPQGVFPVRRSGFVSVRQIENKDIGSRLMVGALLEEGISGAPVIWNGEVIGMVSSRLIFVQQVGLAIPSHIMQRYIKITIK